MNLGILFLHHGTNAVVLNNLSSIRRHNPHATIVTMSDKDPLPGGYSLSSTPALEKLHARNKSRSSDWLVCSWFEQRKEQCDKWWICEWDTFCTTSIEEFYRPVWEFPFVVSCVLRQDRDPRWYWFREVRKLPDGYRDFTIGASPFLYLVSSTALTDACEMLIREPILAANGELRFATAANRCGYAPCGYSPPCDHITWMPIGYLDAQQRSIWHPVKYNVDLLGSGTTPPPTESSLDACGGGQQTDDVLRTR